MTPLYHELHQWMAMPFLWGETNCMFVLGNWIRRVRGTDPFEADRFLFDSAGSCQRETGFFSDPLGVISARMEGAGLERRATPQPGDVGLLRLADERHPVGGLWTGTSWAVKGQRGVITRAPALVEVLAIWEVGYEG